MFINLGVQKLLDLNHNDLILNDRSNIFYFLLLICILLMVEAKSDEKLKVEKRIPVMAWIGPPETESTAARYKEMADAGFTHSFSFIGSLAAMEKAMDAAQAAGIKQFVCCPELKTDPEGVAKKFMNHPAMAGYHLKDEPSAKEFADLAKWAKRIQAVDNKHWCYINLFPNIAGNGALGTGSYQEHVDKFIAEVPTEEISFDHYPIIGNSFRPEFYENLEIIALASHKAKKPFWAFTMAVAHANYPTPKLEHLRLQVFSDLAYGAYGIQYFTYWTPPKYESFVFVHAPIELDGTKSEVYDLAKKMNKEIEGLSGVFMGSEVLNLGHTGKIPKGTKAYEAIAPIESIKTEGNGAVVSLLAQKNRRFLAIVNRDFLATMPLTVSFDADAKLAIVDKEGTLSFLPGKELKITVDKGDMIVLTWVVK